MDRVLRNTASKITVTFYNGSTPVDADTDPTVVVKKADGSTLFSTTATNETGTGIYSVVVPPQALLNILTLTWTGEFSGIEVSIESIVEIVGGFYFTIAELKAFDPAIAKPGRFTDQELIDARTFVESEFEMFCDRAFVPRFHSETGIVADWDSGLLWTEKPELIRINSLTVDGVDQIGWVNSNYLTRDKYSPRALIVQSGAATILYSNSINAEYEYGMTQVPHMIKRKALKRARMVLLGQASTIDERATTMTLPDIGTVNLATPGLRGSLTGVPDIDIVLNDFSFNNGAGVF